jgi:two-component system response regulator AtoC
MVVASPVMSEVLGIVEEAAQFDSAILVTGDSGTGKELVARQVHRRSPRSEGPFVPVNCAALPENLLESELFGHARGAFTGATSAKAGLFEEADGGTLFLDEIGSMAPSLQAKLLRVLEDGHVRRIGENKTRQVSVRIVAATNEQLEAARQRGSFREDLYFRLSVIEIHVPSLKHRIEDILPLVEHFVCIFNKKMGKKVRHIDREAQDALMSYDWKGNVRELQNVVERAMILAEGDSITRACLPEDITTHGRRVMSPESNLWEDLSLKKATKNLEKNLIVAALNRTGGNRSHAAALLEISYPSLLSKIKEYELR